MCEGPGESAPSSGRRLLPWGGNLSSLSCADAVGLWGLWDQEIQSPSTFVFSRAPQWAGLGAEFFPCPVFTFSLWAEVTSYSKKPGEALALLGGLLSPPPGSSSEPLCWGTWEGLCSLRPHRSTVTMEPMSTLSLSVSPLSSDEVGAQEHREDHQRLLGTHPVLLVQPPDLLLLSSL